MRQVANEPDPVAEIVVERGLAGEEAVSAALSEARTIGRPLVRVLAERGVVEGEHLARTLAGALGLELVVLDDVRIHPRVLDRIPGDAAARLGVLPYAVKRQEGGEVLYLVTADPLDRGSLEEARRLGGCSVQPMVASARSLDRAIARQYRRRRQVPLGMIEGARPDPRAATEVLRPRPASNAANEEVKVVRGRPPSHVAVSAPPSSADLHLDRPRDEAEATMQDGPTPPSTTVPDFDKSESQDPPPARSPISDDLVEGPSAFEEKTIDMGDAFRSFIRGAHSNQLMDAQATLPSGLLESLVPVRAPTLVEPPRGPARREPPALEIPVDFQEESHPFGDWTPASVPVGLGETGIIPELSPEDEPFEPPQPEDLPSDPEARRHIAFASDIPQSEDEVGVRSAGSVDEFDAIEAIEEVELDPLDGSDVDELHEVEELDEVEELHEVDELEDLHEVDELEALSELDEPSEPPRLEILSFRAADPDVSDLESPEDELVRAALSGAAAPRMDTPRPAEAFDASGLVEKLLTEQPMSSTERERLMLAIGRLLVRSGVLSRAELVRELEH